MNLFLCYYTFTDFTVLTDYVMNGEKKRVYRNIIVNIGVARWLSG